MKKEFSNCKTSLICWKLSKRVKTLKEFPKSFDFCLRNSCFFGTEKHYNFSLSLSEIRWYNCMVVFYVTKFAFHVWKKLTKKEKKSKTISQIKQKIIKINDIFYVNKLTLIQ